MSQRDPLTDLLRRHDGPVNPAADFADRLEARLLDELGPAADVRAARRPPPVRLRPRRDTGPAPGRRPRWLDLAAVALLLMGVMGGLLSELGVRDDMGRSIPAPGTVAAPDVFFASTGAEAPVMEGGSPARDSRFAGPGPSPGELVELWATPAPFPGSTTAVRQVFPVGEVVYQLVDEVDGPGDTLFAYALATGDPLWSRPNPTGAKVAATETGVLMVLPDEARAATEPAPRSRIAMLAATTGAELWSHALVGTSRDNAWSPIVEGDTVYYADVDARVYALDLATGIERWVSSETRVVLSPAGSCMDRPAWCLTNGFALGDGLIYVATGLTTLMAVDRADGSLRWEVDLAARYGVPRASTTYVHAVPGGVLIKLTERIGPPTELREAGQLVRLDAEGGAHVWGQPVVGQSVFGAPLTTDGERVFLGQVDESGTCCTVVAWGLRSGEPVWASHGTRVYPLGVVGGDVYALGSLTVDGRSRLYALDPATGSVRWQRDLSGTPVLPLAADGTMLVDVVGPAGNRALAAYRPSEVQHAAVMEGGSPARDRRWPGPVQGLGTGALEARWIVDLGDQEQVLRIAPFGDVVYFVAGRAEREGFRVEARRLSDGSVIWSEDGVGTDLTVSAAGVLVAAGWGWANGRLATPHDTTLRLLDRRTGTELWRYALEDVTGYLYHPPIVVGDTIYVADGDVRIHALDATTGSARWVSDAARVVPAPDDFDCRSEAPVCLHLGPVFASGVLYAANVDAEVVAIDPVTGTELWRADIGARYGLTRARVALLATDAGVVVSMVEVSPRPTEDGGHEPEAWRTALLDRDTGDERWTRDDVADVTALSSDGERLFVYFQPPGPDCCSIHALDLATGATEWDRSPLYGYPLGVVDGDRPVLVQVDTRDEERVSVVGVDPATGRELWRFETGRGFPLLPLAQDGTLLALGSDGTLTAFRVVPTPVRGTPVASPVASPTSFQWGR